MVVCLSSMYRALGSIPSISWKEEEKNDEEEESEKEDEEEDVAWSFGSHFGPMSERTREMHR